MARSRKNEERNTQIETLFRAGFTQVLIAKRYGVTTTYVSQVLRARGVSRFEGGKSVIKELLAQARKENKFFDRHGVAPHVIGTLEEAKQAAKKYRKQKRMAALRCIGWEFTFAEWWRVWEESGRWRKRGISSGSHYVMARFGDVGPYSPENIHIVTQSENMKEFWQHNPEHKPRLGKLLDRVA